MYLSSGNGDIKWYVDRGFAVKGFVHEGKPGDFPRFSKVGHCTWLNAHVTHPSFVRYVLVAKGAARL